MPRKCLKMAFLAIFKTFLLEFASFFSHFWKFCWGLKTSSPHSAHPSKYDIHISCCLYMLCLPPFFFFCSKSLRIQAAQNLTQFQYAISLCIFQFVYLMFIFSSSQLNVCKVSWTHWFWFWLGETGQFWCKVIQGVVVDKHWCLNCYLVC